MGQLGPAVQAYEALLSEVKRRGVLEATAQSSTLNNFYIVLVRAGQMAGAPETIEQSMLLGKGPAQRAAPLGPSEEIMPTC